MELEEEPYYLEVPENAGTLNRRYYKRYPTSDKIANLESTHRIFQMVIILLIVLSAAIIGIILLYPGLRFLINLLIIFVILAVLLWKMDTTAMEIKTLKEYAIEYEYLEFYDHGLVVSPFMKVGLSYDPEIYAKYGYQYISHDEINRMEMTNMSSSHALPIVELETNKGEKFRLNFAEAPYFDYHSSAAQVTKIIQEAVNQFRHVMDVVDGE